MIKNEGTFLCFQDKSLFQFKEVTEKVKKNVLPMETARGEVAEEDTKKADEEEETAKPEGDDGDVKDISEGED